MVKWHDGALHPSLFLSSCPVSCLAPLLSLSLTLSSRTVSSDEHSGLVVGPGPSLLSPSLSLARSPPSAASEPPSSLPPSHFSLPPSLPRSLSLTVCRDEHAQLGVGEPAREIVGPESPEHHRADARASPPAGAPVKY